MDWRGKKVLCMGDSLTQAGLWTKRLADNLGCRIYTHCKGRLKMTEIVDGGVGAEGVLEPADAGLFKGMDLIIFFAGYNDRGNLDYPQDHTGDTVDKNTISGALQYCIDRIYEGLTRADNLQCRLLIVTPHCVGRYQYIFADGYEEYPVGSGCSVKTLAETMERTANDNSIPVCNLWKKSGINKYTWPVFALAPGVDEVHCSAAGYERIGDVITGAVLENYGN